MIVVPAVRPAALMFRGHPCERLMVIIYEAVPLRRPACSVLAHASGSRQRQLRAGSRPDGGLRRLLSIVRSGTYASAGSAIDSVDIHSGHIHYGSVKRFKGLEARGVVITDVDELSDDVCSLLYVGATRALQRLVVLAQRDVARMLRAKVGRPPGRPDPPVGTG
jgi:UvrD-like helicase C-terminal domain